MDSEPGVNERADEPGPDRALMIGRVARLQVAVVGRLELRVFGRERAQADGRQKLRARDFEHRLPARLVEHGMFEREREELVGTARGVFLAVLLPALDNVVEVAALRVPEALVEGAPAPFGVPGKLARALLVAGLARPVFEQTERVVPECVDLDGLAAPRRDDPAVALRIHPGQLITFRALHEQAVLRVDVDAEARAFEVALADVVHLGEEDFERDAVVGRPKIAVERVEEPERRVGSVVEALVRAVGEHVGDEAVAYVLAEGSENPAGLAEAARGEGDTFQTYHRVAAPVCEPVVAGDDRAHFLAGGVRARGILLAARGRDDELIRREREFAADAFLRRRRGGGEQTRATFLFCRARVFGREGADGLPV